MSMSIQGMSKRRKYVGSQVMCHLKVLDATDLALFRYFVKAPLREHKSRVDREQKKAQGVGSKGVEFDR